MEEQGIKKKKKWMIPVIAIVVVIALCFAIPFFYGIFLGVKDAFFHKEDWQKYPDYKIEVDAAMKTMIGFSDAAVKGDTAKACDYFEDSIKKSYLEAFNKNPSALIDAGKALKDAKVKYLSPPDKVFEKEPRYMEMGVKHNGTQYTIRLVKYENTWMISIL